MQEGAAGWANSSKPRKNLLESQRGFASGGLRGSYGNMGLTSKKHRIIIINWHADLPAILAGARWDVWRGLAWSRH